MTKVLESCARGIPTQGYHPGWAVPLLCGDQLGDTGLIRILLRPFVITTVIVLLAVQHQDNISILLDRS